MRLMFDRKLYAARAIRKTAEVFASVAVVDVGTRGRDFTVDLEARVGKPIPAIAQAFENYALAETVRIRRG